MNLCVFTGRLTRDVELTNTTTGKSVASFSIAVNEGKDQNDQELVTFVNCQAWGGTAETINKYFGKDKGKGKPITVQCRLRNEKWTDAEGQNRRSEKFIVDRFVFVPLNSKQEGVSGVEEVVNKKPKNRKARNTEPVESNDEFIPTEEEDDIPF